MVIVWCSISVARKGLYTIGTTACVSLASTVKLSSCFHLHSSSARVTVQEKLCITQRRPLLPLAFLPPLFVRSTFRSSLGRSQEAIDSFCGAAESLNSGGLGGGGGLGPFVLRLERVNGGRSTSFFEYMSIKPKDKGVARSKRPV